MKIRIQTICFFLLTFAGSIHRQRQQHHNQLSVDCCCGAAVAATMPTKISRRMDDMPPENQQTTKGNNLEMENLKQNKTKAYATIIGDITATTATTQAATSKKAKNQKFSNSQSIKKFKGHELTQNFAQDFRENVARLFANDAPTSPAINSTAEEIATNGSSTVPPHGTTAESLPHQTERRHILTHDKLQYTKEIRIKHGRLIGIVRRFQPTSGLRDVAQYLGLPYAEAPVGSRRFMPPGTPSSWQGLKIARHLPPVCPQKLPDVSIQSAAKMSRGRYKHLTRLMPYLRTESEDCLYLNLYVPQEESMLMMMEPSQQQYPVLVYLHGESFEWNSGNGYDGSILASYGEVIVVTVNYRLGVLGFMRPSMDEHDIANFALLDQIAALHWIKENIGSFGGDNTRVTLMGHGTGAACVNYLMVSPVASGLFHRAILMSGSAMSDWAASNHTLQLTMQIAHALECPLSAEHEQLLECLRQRRYQDILKIPTSFPQFSTSLGPIVDGHVIPNQPYKVMGHYTEHFSRYDLLFGITESESYHTLGALALEEGLSENERDNLLRFYMQNRFDVRPDLALAATLKKYQDLYNNPIKATNLEHRDIVLDILSDARVVGPLLQTGLFHADVNHRNYMYVFGHNSAAGPHASLPHSIMGEELAFIFGAPLAPAGAFPATNYTAQEKLLSEAVMAYWTNFVKTGNPKAPWKGSFINSNPVDWDRYDVDWPEFNKRTQAYLNIGIPPSVGYKYRQIYMNFWNKELPDELNQIAAIQVQQQPFLQQKQQLLAKLGASGGGNDATSLLYALPASGTATTGGSDVITGHMSKYGNRDNGAEDPVRTLKLLLQEPLGGGNGAKPLQVETAENMYNSPPTFGHVHKLPTSFRESAGGEFYTLPGATIGNTLIDTEINGEEHSVGQQHQQHETASTPGAETGSAGGQPIAKSETTLQLLIGLIVVFIVLNVIIYSTFLLQKRRKATTMKRKLGIGILSYDGATDDELKRTTKQHGDGDGNDSYIMDSLTRKSNTYEAIERRRSPINGYKITRQLSSSTVDTHTKVCEWMSASTLPRTTHTQNNSGSFAPAQPMHKLNMGVDTGNACNQATIELGKLKSDGHIIICQDVEVADQALLTPQDSLDTSCYELQRQHSTATEPSDAILIQSQHAHTRSDPVDSKENSELVTSFVDDGSDINVTSRDEPTSTLYALAALTPAQQLALLKQRNYPKVLPTTTTTAGERLTDSPPMTSDLSTTYKRNSLPPNSFLPIFPMAGKHAPAPPPRTISTLGRKPSLGRRRNSNILTTSPLQLAQDVCDDDAEARVNQQIAQNTLIVGPIVPKTTSTKLSDNCIGECNYSTLQRNNSNTDAYQTQEMSKQEPAVFGLSTVDVNHLRPQPPTTLRLAGGLCGSFQSFESVPPTVAEEQAPTNAAHHTERVYAIKPGPSSAPTTPAATAAGITGWPITPNGAIYAQPMKSASKTSLIPRKLPLNTKDNQQNADRTATTTNTTNANTNTQAASTVRETNAQVAVGMTATKAPENTSLASANTIEASNLQQMPTAYNQLTATTTNVSLTIPTTTTTTTTTSTAAGATTTRIPQMQRVVAPQQQINKDKLSNATPASSAAMTNSAAAVISTSTSTITTTPNSAASASATQDTASARTSSTCSSASTASSSSCSSCHSSCSSSSSSSTGTVRTELQQHHNR